MPSSKGNADQTSHGTWTLGICSRFFFCIHQHCKLPKNTFFCQEWHHHKDEDILTYRDKSFASKFTGESSFTANIRTLSLCRHPVHCPSLCVFVSFLMFVCLPINIYDSSLFAGTQSSVHHIVCLFLCLFLFVCLFVD